MYANHLTRTADILLSEQEDGEVRVNVGYGSENAAGIAADCTVWGPDGFYSMPNDPGDGYCEALILEGGDKRRVIGTKDIRWAPKAGSMKQGDRIIASNCDARLMLVREKNKIALYSTNQTDGDSTMLMEMDGSTGDMQFVNGPSFIRITKDSIQMTAGGSVLEIDAAGVGVFGAHFACNTGGGNLGTLGPLPPPPTMAICSGAVGMSAIGSSKFTVAV